MIPSPPPPSPSLTAPLPPALFCDYYNPPGECEWHYEPCGNRSFETCRTVNGIHSNISVSYLEGEGPHAVLLCVPGGPGSPCCSLFIRQSAGSLS